MPFTKEKHQYTTEAICIRSMDFGEADKILHFYSPRIGRIGAIAKGARKQKSRIAGACEILNISEIQLSKGRNLDVLCQYQSLNSFFEIRQDLLRLAYGLLFIELVDLIAAEHDLDSATIYHVLKESLRRLGSGEEDPVRVAVAFQMRLLDAVGYYPSLTACILCGLDLQPFQATVKSPPTPLQGGTSLLGGKRDSSSATYYPFSPQLGGIICADCSHEVSASTLVNVSTTTLEAIQEATLHETAALLQDNIWQNADKMKIQKFLTFYFSDKLEKKLKACDFLYQQLTLQEGS